MLCIGLLVLALICGATENVHAQVAGGNISGTVTDSSARVIANVQIKITNIATGVSREITTNDEGVYSAPNLQAGTLWFAKTLHALHYNDFFLLGVTPSAWIAG
jgi:hypothetical protein